MQTSIRHWQSVITLFIVVLLAAGHARGQCLPPNSPQVYGITATSAQFYWQSSGSGITYELDYQVQGATAWTTLATTTTTYSLTGLTNNTGYNWRVRSKCGATLSANTAVMSFTATCNIPTSPSSYSITASTAYLSWVSTGSSGYQADYRVQGATAWTTTTSTTNSRYLSGLAGSTAYEWRVRSDCGGGIVSANTAVLSFTTTCDVPSYAYSSGVSDNAATLAFGSATGATYQIDYRVQGAANFTTIPTTSTYYSLTGLTNNTTYEWRVRTVCAGGNFSAYTATQIFTTVCNTPASLTADNTTPTSVRLRWAASSSGGGSAGTYEINYQQRGASTWNSLTVVTTTTTSYTLTGLTNNTVYDWRIRANCGTTQSAYAAPQSFTTVCNATTNLLSQSVSFSSANLSWSAVNLVAGYELDYRPQGTTVFTTGPVPTNTFSLTGLTNNTVYEYRVRSVCEAGILSANSSLQSFTTVCNNPTSLAVQANSYAAALNWYGPAGAQYNLQWRQGNSGTWNTIPNITRTQYVLTGLTNGGVYQAQVQTVCGAQTSASFTAPVSFTANCPQPSGLSSSASSYDATKRDFYWSQSGGGNSIVRWRTVGSSTWLNSPLTGSGYSVYGLTPAVYEWQVGAVCTDGTATSYTPGSSFTVVVSCDPTPPAAYVSVGYNVAMLQWTSNQGLYEVRWRPQGASVWNIATNITGAANRLILRNLTGGTVYEWQIRTLCATNPNTSFGNSLTFSTPGCNPPSSLSTYCITPNEAGLFWKFNAPDLGIISGNLGYYLGLDNSDFSDQYELNWRPVGASSWNTVSGLTGNGYNLTGLTNNTAYEWQVRSRTACTPGVSNTFTAPQSFTTQCPAPTGLYAYTTTTDCTIATLGLGGCDTPGVQYNLRYRPVGSANWVVLSNVSSANVTGLTGNTQYEFQAQTNCGNNGLTAFSTSVLFSTPVCTTTTTVSTTNCYAAYSNAATGITSTGALLNFGGTAPFEVRWRTGSTGTWNTAQTSASATTYQLSGLLPGTAYDWQVRSTCGATNDFSPTVYFRTGCNIPAIATGATADVRATSAQLSWQNVQNGLSYEVRYRAGSGAWVSVTTSVTGLYGTVSYQLQGLTNNTAYEWQVRQICPDNSTSDWSYSLFFTTLCPASSSLFTDRIDGTSVRCNWQRPYDGSNFNLQYRPQGSTTWTTVSGTNITNSQTSGRSGLLGALTSYTVTGLSPQTVYEWQVLTDCSNGASSTAPTQPLTFVTTATGTTPPCTTMITVQNGDWTNPATWSCNRIPTITDDVQVLHAVTLPGNSTANARKISFGTGGKVSYGTGARVVMGQ